ncbi:MAG TPA: DUF2461 domain-containing protein [Rudaea sp.]|jgi:uncharacterized protein (TIGR02453 family)|nr:DUF2461 domain-containing protein [Rudaea sp.]
MAASTAYVTAASFRFLRELARNNNREWFAANKARYEKTTRDPFLRLIGDLAAPLARISPHFRADPRPSGGSMFRIYRDTRFANDKTPYKAWLGARLFHERSRQVPAPVFYLHVAPGRCFVGGGLWHPESATVKRIRDFLVDNPAAWKKAVQAKRFRERFELDGESLTRPPRGYDPAHELIDDIKRKDFVATRHLSDGEAMSAQLPKIVIDGCKSIAPMIDYLCAALDLEF